MLAKRTANLMQPQLAAKIDKATRKQFPDGIWAMAPTHCAIHFILSPPREGTSNSILGGSRAIAISATRSGMRPGTCLSHADGHDLYLDRGEDSLADRWIKSRMAVDPSSGG